MSDGIVINQRRNLKKLEREQNAGDRKPNLNKAKS